MGPSPDIASPSTTSPKQGRTRGKNTDASPQNRTKESAATPPLQGWGRGGGGADHYTLVQHFSRMNQHGFAGQPASPVGDREQTEVEGSIPLLALHPWYAAYMTYCEWILQQRSVKWCFAALLGDRMQSSLHRASVALVCVALADTS